MHSKVAEDTRETQREREAAMSLEERERLLAQANALSIELYANFNGVTRREAEAILRGAIATERRTGWRKRNRRS